MADNGSIVCLDHCFYFFEKLDLAKQPVMQIKSLAFSPAFGTSARIEREYKLALNQTGLSDSSLISIQTVLYEAISKSIYEDDWQTPSLVNKPYFIRSSSSFVIGCLFQ